MADAAAGIEDVVACETRAFEARDNASVTELIAHAAQELQADRGGICAVWLP